MTFSATVGNVLFDLTQSGVNASSFDGQFININYTTIESYFLSTNQQILASQFNDFFYNGILNISGSNQNDIIRPSITQNGNFVYSQIRLNIDAGAGDDLIAFDSSSKSYFINGGTGNDTITGGSYNDTIIGGDGDDMIRTGGGNGLTDGGDGNDVIYTLSYGPPNSLNQPDAASGGNGDDLLIGEGNGLDYLYGDAGNDTIDGGAGDDVLNGGADNDRIIGNTGDDTLVGGSGNDLLIGGEGWDNLNGGTGNDVFGVRLNSIRDYITDFTSGEDKIRIDPSIASDFASLDANSDVWVEGNWGVIQIHDGPMILLQGVDTTKMSADWFDFAFV